MAKLDDLMYGVDGELRIVRPCPSQRCGGKERVFHRIGKTQDQVHWAYHCPICDNYLYTAIPASERMRDIKVRT